MRASMVLLPTPVVGEVAGTDHPSPLRARRHRPHQLAAAAHRSLMALAVPMRTTTMTDRCPSLATAQAAWQVIFQGPSALGSRMSLTTGIGGERPRMPMTVLLQAQAQGQATSVFLQQAQRVQRREEWQSMVMTTRQQAMHLLPLQRVQLPCRWIAMSTRAAPIWLLQLAGLLNRARVPQARMEGFHVAVALREPSRLRKAPRQHSRRWRR